MRMNVAYLRVSTEGQIEKYGLDLQRQKINDFCEQKGIKIDKWYIDGGFSGKNIDRPQITELLVDASRGLIECVYIYKLDRMSRDVVDTLNLLYKVLPEYNVKIVSMTEELKFDRPMDKAMIGINAVFNQYEREVISMRMRAGMIERVKRGLWMGGGRIPYGYYYDRNDGILHPKEDEAIKVRQAFEMYYDGYSCDKIAMILGFSCERIVAQILKRKSNIGIIEYKGKEYQGRHLPIVDKELFYKVQVLMKKRSTNSHINNNNLLTGLCYCGECGARMRYHKWGGKHKIICYSQITGKDYMRRSNCCHNTKHYAAEIEEIVVDHFKEFAINVTAGDKAPNKIDSLEALVKKSSAKLKKLYNLYAEDVGDSDVLLSSIKEEEKSLKSLQEELKNEREKVHDTSSSLNEIKRMSEIWDELSNQDRNKILKNCVEKIVINGDNIEIRFITF